MDIIGKDCVGYIFQFLSPTDWYCVSLVCKPWWSEIKKFLSQRKILFYKIIEQIDFKNNVCLRPFYYLKPIYSGCQGDISNNLCLRHSENSDICQNCLQRPVSTYFPSNYCDSHRCREYIIIIKNGQAECVKAYPCKISLCSGKTDTIGGFCYNHAIEAYEKNRSKNNIQPVYYCIAKTKKGTKCQNNTKSRIKKCHLHINNPLIR